MVMIVYPENWQNIGKPIKIENIEKTILTILNDINCNSIALSGGIDSSLIIYYLNKIHKNINAFTIGLSKNHPDIQYSKLAVNNIQKIKHYIYIPTKKEIINEQQKNDYEGDVAVRLFYKYVKKYTDRIIACDGIDEFMCGYYGHQKNPNEKTYYKYIRKLQVEQLKPLNKNSFNVKVYLPYLNQKLLTLLYQIPIYDKVDINERKKIMVKIAKDKLPIKIIERRKYGFCDALKIKG